MTEVTNGKTAQESKTNILGIRSKDGGKTTILPQHDGTILVQVKGAGERSFNPQRASLLNRKRFEFIGAKEDLADTMAVELANVPAGKSLAEVKFERVCARIDFLETGTDLWRAERATVVRESAEQKRTRELAERRGDVVLALLRVKGFADVDALNSWLSARQAKLGKSRDETLDVLGAADQVREEVLRIQAARLAREGAEKLANELLDDIE